MNDPEVLQQLTTIFKHVFDLKTLHLTAATTADEIEEWDSLSHLHLIVSIEKHFKISFTTFEIQRLNNVGELIDVIEQKLIKK